MEAISGRQQFDDADALFRAGRYGEALVSLEALNRAYPNTKNVLFPMALCLEHLGRGGEALPICARLVAQFQDPRAMEMQRRLSPSSLGASLDTLEFAGDYELPDLGPLQTVPAIEQEEERVSPWKVGGMIGGGVLALLLLLCIPSILQKLGIADAPQESEGGPSAVSILELGLVLLGFAAFQALGTGVASFSLGVVKKLPANTFSGVLLHVGTTLLGANIIALIVSLFLVAAAPLYLIPTAFVVEHVVMLAVFAYTYKFSVGDTFIFFAFFFIFMCVAAFVAMMLLGGGIGLATFVLSFTAFLGIG